LVALVNSSSPTDDLYAGQFCGGVLISADMVLTARHCVEKRQPHSIDAVVSATNLCQGAAIEGNRMPVAAIEEVDPSLDVAVLRLSAEATSPPLHVMSGVPEPGERVTAWGWGGAAVGGDGCTPSRIPLSVVDDSQCAAFVGERADRNDGFCAVPALAAPRNTCRGDSGGPVVERFNMQDYIVGITLIGASCAIEAPGYYGSYPLLRRALSRDVNIQVSLRTRPR
jgi:secreted trypsin-like serine protease